MSLTLTAWHVLCRAVEHWGYEPSEGEQADSAELEAAGLVRRWGETLRPTRKGAYYYSVRWFMWYRRTQAELWPG